MACKCGSIRLLGVGGKCNDLSNTSFGTADVEGYVPHIPGIGGGDYINISICVDCGTLQGFKTGMTNKEIITLINNDE